jgi:transcriptional regulator with XRE-family HTH domain
MSNVFGLYLRNIRKGSRVSLDTLGDLCGLSKQYLSDIERGRNSPPSNQKMLGKIAICLKLDEKQKRQLTDYAAEARGDVPDDIKKILLTHPNEIEKLRREYAEK